MPTGFQQHFVSGLVLFLLTSISVSCVKQLSLLLMCYSTLAATMLLLIYKQGLCVVCYAKVYKICDRDLSFLQTLVCNTCLSAVCTFLKPHFGYQDLRRKVYTLHNPNMLAGTTSVWLLRIGCSWVSRKLCSVTLKCSAEITIWSHCITWWVFIFILVIGYAD